MAPRAIWKGHLEIGQLVCPVALHAAASTSERVAFHIVNRKTGHRVRRVFVDAETGEPVERDDQAKGYETDRGKTIVVEDEELAEAVPESDKTLRVEAFIPCGEVDTLYFDRPYYLTPDGEAAETAFAVIRAGLAKRKAAAVARTVLFRRLRPVLIRAQGAGLVADTLEFDHEVRDAAKVFDDIPELKLDKEMLDLARHIIDTKRGKFQPERFEDRYDDALAALVKAKAEGKAIPKPKPPEAAKPIDLMEALRKSAAAKAKAQGAGKARRHRGARPADVALETYRRKRDFSATDEPAGTDRRGHGDAFVVQKHAARRLHYDLRLEIGDALASWAVTRGPSLVPGDKRLAVHVEDHPLDYADFEGEIPKGQYGGGEVIVWDRGRWEPEGDPVRGLKKGRLDFTLEGAKLKGRWHLVRMGAKRGEKRENWLLIKGSDEAARSEADPDILEEEPESVISGRTVEDIAAGRQAARKPPAKRAGKPRQSQRGIPRLHPAGARDPEAQGAGWRRLGARDQVRRLPAAGADPRRQGEALDPERPGLDRPLRRGTHRRPRGAALQDRDPRRRARGRGRRRRLRLLGAAGGPVGEPHRPLPLLPVRPPLPRRRGPARRAARRPQGPAGGAAERRAPSRFASASISTRTARSCCGTPAGSASRGWSPSSATPPIRPAAPAPGSSRSAPTARSS